MKIYKLGLKDSVGSLQAMLHRGDEVYCVSFRSGEKHLVQQFGALIAALEVHAEREKERVAVWRQSGIKGQVVHCFAKAERAFTAAFRDELPSVDNFIDLMNYAAFAYRLTIEDRANKKDLLNGEWPWQ